MVDQDGRLEDDDSGRGWPVDSRVQIGVEDALQLSRDLGQQPAPDRDHPVFRPAQDDPRARIAMSSAGSAPSGSRYCTITCARIRRSSGVAGGASSPSTAASASARRPSSAPGQRPRTRGHTPQDPHLRAAGQLYRPGPQRVPPVLSLPAARPPPPPRRASPPASPATAPVSEPRRQLHLATHGLRRLHHSTSASGIRPQHPLQQLAHRPTPESTAECHLTRPGRARIDRCDRLHDQRLHAPLHLPATRKSCIFASSGNPATTSERSSASRSAAV